MAHFLAQLDFPKVRVFLLSVILVILRLERQQLGHGSALLLINNEDSSFTPGVMTALILVSFVFNVFGFIKNSLKKVTYCVKSLLPVPGSRYQGV